MRHFRCYKKQRQNGKIKREHPFQKGIRYDDLLMLQMVEIFEDDLFLICIYIPYIYRINLYLLTAVVDY